MATDTWLTRLHKAQVDLDRQIAELDPGYTRAVQWMPVKKMEDTPLVVCECGVAITGGLHSDWCPLKDTDG